MTASGRDSGVISSNFQLTANFLHWWDKLVSSLPLLRDWVENFDSGQVLTFGLGL